MSKRQIDKSTVVGALLAVSGIVAGLLLDGGTARQILQPTAALIVLGGTLGAVMIQFPMQTIREAIKELRHGVLDDRALNHELVEELVSWCLQARRMGMLALDAYLPQIQDAFFRKGMMMAVDGVGVRELRETLEIDLDVMEEREAGVAKVLEAAGGFAPTLGIIGAVLGLIQVMQRMDNVAEIGKGIAVAFVSTLYGIGLANLVFLPLAGKLKIRMRERQIVREMTLEAVISILEGRSGRALRQRLEAYLVEGPVVAQTQAEPEMAT